MDLQQLRHLLPDDVASDLDTLAASFRRQRGEATTTTFLGWLYEQQAIDASILGDVLGRVPVEVREAGAAPSERYELIGLLGRGAMGEVHVAREAALNRNVAIKRMDPHLAGDPDVASRFHTEAQVTAQLDHPGIVPVYAWDVLPDGTREYAMKLIRGRTLEDLLDDVRAVLDQGARPDEDHSLDARLDLFVQVCNALSYAHARGVIHRDLKPANIMVGAFHEVIVMDWGIARILGADEAYAPIEAAPGRGHETQAGFIMGTPRYMAPEQAEARNDELDAHTDQYALGLILQELITLAPPREGGTSIQMIFAASQGKRAPMTPHPGAGRVPRELRAIVDRATALAPEERYADVEALADDVRRYQRDEEVLAAPDSAVQGVQRWIGHHRGAAMAAILGLVLAVVVVGVVTAGVGLASVEANRRDAAHREERLSHYLGAVSETARHMDTELRRIEGLLQGLAFATERSLGEAPRPVDYYLEDGFGDPERAPPDLVPSERYDGPISLAHPDSVVAAGVREVDVRRTLWHLNSLTPTLREVLLRGRGAEVLDLPRDQQDRLILAGRSPVVWTYVATEDGALVGYPGQGLYGEGYDPRQTAWYREADGAREPVWTVAGVDESDLGLLLTCARGVYDGEGDYRGLAALDLTYRHVVDLMEPGLPVQVDTWLVDRQGRVQVESAMRDEAHRIEEYQLRSFPHDAVLEQIRSGEGPDWVEHEVEGERRLYAWSELETLGMTYVVGGAAADLLR